MALLAAVGLPAAATAQSPTFGTYWHAEVSSGTSINVPVSGAGATEGLYIVVGSTKYSVLGGVSGGGLTWNTPTKSGQCAGRAQTHISWRWARGTPNGSNITLSYPIETASIAAAVIRIDGAPNSQTESQIFVDVNGWNTLGKNGACSGGTDNGSLPFTVVTDGPDRLIVSLVNWRRDNIFTKDADHTQHFWHQAGSSGSSAIASMTSRVAATAGSYSDLHTLSSDKDWSMLTFAIKPGAAPSYGVDVTPASTTASRLPSNGTNYTVDFNVENTGSATDNFDLLTTKLPGTAISVVSITGTGITQGGNPDSARLASLGAGASATATVTYSVGDVAAGSIDTLVFTARSVGSPTTSDAGRLVLTVIRPTLTTGKAVNPTGTQAPGTDLTYTITFTNAGSAAAVSAIVVDTLPGQVDFKVGSVVSNPPAGVSVAVEYSNDGGATWTYVPASGACAAPAGYDRCVNRVRWRLLNDLSSVPPDNTGTLEFVARIR